MPEVEHAVESPSRPRPFACQAYDVAVVPTPHDVGEAVSRHVGERGRHRPDVVAAVARTGHPGSGRPASSQPAIVPSARPRRIQRPVPLRDPLRRRRPAGRGNGDRVERLAVRPVGDEQPTVGRRHRDSVAPDCVGSNAGEPAAIIRAPA